MVLSYWITGEVHLYFAHDAADILKYKMAFLHQLARVKTYLGEDYLHIYFVVLQRWFQSQKLPMHHSICLCTQYLSVGYVYFQLVSDKAQDIPCVAQSLANIIAECFSPMHIIARGILVTPEKVT